MPGHFTSDYGTVAVVDIDDTGKEPVRVSITINGQTLLFGSEMSRALGRSLVHHGNLAERASLAYREIEEAKAKANAD